MSELATRHSGSIPSLWTFSTPPSGLQELAGSVSLYRLDAYFFKSADVDQTMFFKFYGTAFFFHRVDAIFTTCRDVVTRCQIMLFTRFSSLPNSAA